MNRWNRLDNVAILYPTAMHKAETQVFRFSCELTEPVRSDALQKALNETLERFELYRYILKRGFFWYYLEETDLKPVVREEYKDICAPLYHRNRKDLLFEITYYQNRVNLEVHHILSDGTGALMFLQMLMTKYVSQVKHLPEPSVMSDSSMAQMRSDAFRTHYSGAPGEKKRRLPPAAQLRGWKYTENRVKVITGRMSAKAVLELAHRNNTTVTIFLCACMLLAVAGDLTVRDKRKPVVLNVPVNLRKYFPSESIRNFFNTIAISYNFSKSPQEFGDVLASVSNQFREKVTLEHMRQSMNAYASIEHNVLAKIAPLALKDVSLRCIYLLSRRQTSAGFSNVGVVTMPEETVPFLRAVDVMTSTNRVQVCMCTLGDAMSINFTMPFVSSEVPRLFFRTLTEAGVDVTISSNMLNGKD